jgi:DNA-binding CsgD family transcriptional regulator
MIERNTLELAANLASRSAGLPAIATCNWCQSAADALCIARSRCIAVVRFVRHDDGGPLRSQWPGPGVSSMPENQPLVEAIRGALRHVTPDSIEQGDLWRRDPDDDCMIAAITLDPGSPRTSLALSVLAFAGGRSALLASAEVDLLQGIELRVMIIESTINGEPLFTESDAEALRAAMHEIVRRARLAFILGLGVAAESLNPREVEVLESLTRGKSIREIAVKMHKSTHTIHDYLKSMHRKIGVGSRAELIAMAAGRCAGRESAAPVT